MRKREERKTKTKKKRERRKERKSEIIIPHPKSLPHNTNPATTIPSSFPPPDSLPLHHLKILRPS
jgi:hypothetical protein